MTGTPGVINMTNIDNLCFTAMNLNATWHPAHIWQISDSLESAITGTGKSHSLHICLPCRSACDGPFHKKCDSSGKSESLYKTKCFTSHQAHLVLNKTNSYVNILHLFSLNWPFRFGSAIDEISAVKLATWGTHFLGQTVIYTAVEWKQIIAITLNYHLFIWLQYSF